VRRGVELHAAEERREQQRQARIAGLRQRFVDGRPSGALTTRQGSGLFGAVDNVLLNRVVVACLRWTGRRT
jgi:hypothetical protein